MLVFFATFFQRSVYLKLLWNHFFWQNNFVKPKIFGLMGADVVNLVNFSGPFEPVVVLHTFCFLVFCFLTSKENPLLSDLKTHLWGKELSVQRFMRSEGASLVPGLCPSIADRLQQKCI